MKQNKLKLAAVSLFAAALLWTGIGNTGLASVSASAETTYQGVDYEAVFNADYYAQANPDVAAALGGDSQLMLQHFATVGIREGRVACADFNIEKYIEYNQDLVPVLGTEDVSVYYLHYIQAGKAEGRRASDNAANVENIPVADNPAVPAEAVLQQQVHDIILAQEASFPEGMPWTNDNYYMWNGGIYQGGYGCAGFAFAMSDVAFGAAPSYVHQDYNNIKVGDILRVDHNMHSVVVLEVHPDHVIVTEGNYNGTIHWGRKIPISQLPGEGNYVMSRYAM